MLTIQLMIHKFTQYFWSAVLVLASVRGALVYHLGLPPDIIYVISGSMLVCFGLLSFRYMLTNKTDNSLIFLGNAIKINFFLIGFYMVGSMVLISFNQYSLAYSFAIFPIVFTLIKYDEKILNGIVVIITLITTFGVYHFFNIGISAGFEGMAAANLMLRPGELIYSRIGENLLPGGYQGRHHDAANILVMCGVFFLTKSMLAHGLLRFLYFAIYCLVLSTALLTGSGANIVILITVSSFCVFLYAKRNPCVITVFAVLVLLLLPLLTEFFSDKLYFWNKVSFDQSELEGGGIFNSLDFESVVKSLPAILIGFGYIFEVPMIDSEIAFVKGLIQLGFIPFLVLMFIIFSPIYYIYFFGKSLKVQARAIKSANLEFSITNFMSAGQAHQQRLIVAAMPVLAGTLTLLHYGSLFRVTSIGLFCVLISIFFKEYITLKREMQLFCLSREWIVAPVERAS